MDLNAVRMFVSVVQCGSLSSAATRLEIPLPTLSRRVRELERELRVQLLERTARGTYLTDAGARLYEFASRGVEELDEAERAVLSDQLMLRGRLRLALPPAFEPWWELLSAFQRRYPGVHVQSFTTDRHVDLIEDGIDVALRVGDVDLDSVVARHVFTYRHVLVASPELIDELGAPEHPEDLHRFPCALWSLGGGTRSAWNLGACEVKPSAQLVSNDYAHLRSRVLAGDVVAELPPFLARPGLTDGRLVPLLADFPLPEQKVNLLYPARRNTSSIVRTYLEFCRENLDVKELL